MARDDDISLLVMQTRAARSIGEVLFGSVATEVLGEASDAILPVVRDFAAALELSVLLYCVGCTASAIPWSTNQPTDRCSAGNTGRSR